MPLQIAAVLLAMLVGSAPVSPTVTPAPITVARLEVTITTTSDWSTVSISRGRLTVSKEVSRPADVTLFATANGWTVRAPGGVSRTIVVRGVFEEDSGAPTMRIALSKGLVGYTLVDIKNTTGQPFLATRIGNSMTSAGPTGEQIVVQWRTRDQFFGTTVVPLAHADPARRVLAFYYGWFSPQSFYDPQLADRPSEPFNTQQYPGILELTKLARTGGIDGFIVSYADANSPGVFADAIRAAEQEGGVAAPYLEIKGAHAEGAEGTKPAVVLGWLRDVLSHANSPAFLRSGGEPVVFVYEMERIGVPGWQKILEALATEGLHVRLVGDAPLDKFGTVEWGLHSYNVAVTYDPAQQLTRERAAMLDTRLLTPLWPGGLPHLYAATVTPGYDDRNLRGMDRPIVERGANGERYEGSWKAAIASQPDWVLITSWNEWFEASSVQPSVAYGDLALRQTATQSELFRTHGG
jgi:hypothetical protein